MSGKSIDFLFLISLLNLITSNEDKFAATFYNGRECRETRLIEEDETHDKNSNQSHGQFKEPGSG